jgi:ABC-type nickel/cobalt efflux system permease component RcnA
MKLADGIRKHGFRKWYERELLSGHAHLALLLLCVLGLMLALEAAMRFQSLADRLTDAAAVLVCAGVGVWALRRYLYLLTHAEAVANQADCPRCKAYGRLELVDADEAGTHVQVRCRGCAHEWRIED